MDSKHTATGASSLGKMSQDAILKDLKIALSEEARAATFACGGSLPITGSASDPMVIDSKTTKPVQIRFGEQNVGSHVTLPADGINSLPLQHLLDRCAPASFGLGSKDVFDESYRKAGKLDPTEFLTSFCPYEEGIIDIIAQLLLPNASESNHTRSVRAELYKLNVYSGPSGRFKAHVDTPRSEQQFGSLVVALPVAHQGGELVVRNSGKEVVFDWSVDLSEGATTGARALNAIQWAAFYSDCEHEVLEVTSGHRLTLTYNLFVTRGNGNLTGHAAALDPSTLPLYKSLQTALETPSFLEGGRVLGVWLTHSYAHTNKHCNFLPSSLKGADMAIYETACKLGLWCYLHPVVRYSEDVKDEDSPTAEWDEDDGDGEYGDWGQRIRSKTAFAASFRDFIEEAGSTDHTPMHEIVKEWSAGDLDESKITWLKEEGEDLSEPAFGYVAYGNEGSVGIKYSAAVLLIRVPPFSERGSGSRQMPRDMFDGIRSDEQDTAGGAKKRRKAYEDGGSLVFSVGDAAHNLTNVGVEL